MIKKYKQFSINENWQNILKILTKDIANSVLKKDELEDFFLELDCNTHIELSCGREYSTWFAGISSLDDISNYNCFPYYRIKVSKNNDLLGFDNFLEITKLKIDFYNKVKSIISRIENIVNGIVIENDKKFVNTDNHRIDVTFTIKINKRIPPILSSKKTSLKDYIISAISKATYKNTNDKLFIIKDIKTDYILVDSNSHVFKNTDTSSILSSILRKFSYCTNIIKLPDDYKSEYKIEIYS